MSGPSGTRASCQEIPGSPWGSPTRISGRMLPGIPLLSGWFRTVGFFRRNPTTGGTMPGGRLGVVRVPPPFRLIEADPTE